MRIAVLEDNHEQMAHVVHLLTHKLGLDAPVVCEQFHSGEALRRALRNDTYDLLVLDWNVPDLDGIDLLQWLRNFQKSSVPVIMLTSRDSERDVARALGLGADDYSIKPFRSMEFCARVLRLIKPKVVLEREIEYVFGRWTFDRTALAVVLHQPSGEMQKVPLTDREFKLALSLFQHLGEPVSRSYLLQRTGVSGEEMPSRALDSHIYRLRGKLFLDSSHGIRLQTIYGHGYRLEMLDAAPAASTDAVAAVPATGG